MNIIDVNVMRHGDGKQVYVSVRQDGLDFVLRGDQVHVHIDPNLPDDTDQVTISDRDRGD